MVEERRAHALTDSELDAALAKAFTVEPSPDFAARVRRRLANEEIAVTRPFPFLAATAVLAAAAIVFVVVMLERRPETEQPRVRVAGMNDRDHNEAPGRTAVVGMAAGVQRALAPVDRHSARPVRNRPNAERRTSESDDVLIPAGEQQALRRLLERPPTAVLRFAQPGSDEPIAVAAIAIPPLDIDPLSHQIEEGGHQ
jgi:hypothetical protein